MRVLVTGGTGFIGSAVVAELMGAGHDVVALARSERSASALAEAGAEPVRGSLEETEVLHRAASSCDAVVHTAFGTTSPRDFRRSARIEREALAALGGAFSGSGRPLVAAGGLAPVRGSGPLLETDPTSGRRGLLGRNVELTMRELAADGVNASVVRLPCVHGLGDRFTLATFIRAARAHRRSVYPRPGTNLLPAVHRDDAATVFRLALERAQPAVAYHAVAEPGVPVADIAAAIGRQLGVPVAGVGPGPLVSHFGLFAGYVRSNRPASGELTRRWLGWEPSGPGLLADLDRPEYVTAVTD